MYRSGGNLPGVALPSEVLRGYTFGRPCGLIKHLHFGYSSTWPLHNMETVPDHKEWQVLYGYGVYICSAVEANRYIYHRWLWNAASATAIVMDFASILNTASATVKWCFGSHRPGVFPGVDEYFELPAVPILPAGWAIYNPIINQDADDLWGLDLFVLERTIDE